MWIKMNGTRINLAQIVGYDYDLNNNIIIYTHGGLDNEGEIPYFVIPCVSKEKQQEVLKKLDALTKVVELASKT